METFFKKLFVMAVCLALGYVVLRYRRATLEWTGQWVWAERYLGRWGTSVALGAIGVGLVFIGFAYPFGILDSPTPSARPTLQVAPLQNP